MKHNEDLSIIGYKISPMFSLQVARVGPRRIVVVTIVGCIVPSEFRGCLLVTILNFLSTALDIAIDMALQRVNLSLGLNIIFENYGPRII